MLLENRVYTQEVKAYWPNYQQQEATLSSLSLSESTISFNFHKAFPAKKNKQSGGSSRC